MFRTIKELLTHTPPPNSPHEFNKEYQGSGAKNFKNPEIAGGDYWLLSFGDRPYLGQFTPLDFAKIDNQSNFNILVKLNQEDRYAVPIPSGSSDTIQIGKFHSLQIVNLDDTNPIPAEKIKATVMKTPRSESDDYIEEQKKMAGLS